MVCGAYDRWMPSYVFLTQLKDYFMNELNQKFDINDIEPTDFVKCIYVISNPAWPDYVKLGYGSGADRPRAYQTYSPHRDYVMHWVVFTNHWKELEDVAHRHFNAKGEWIKTDDFKEVVNFCREWLSEKEIS